MEMERPASNERMSSRPRSLVVVAAALLLGVSVVAIPRVALASTIVVKAATGDKWNPTHAYIGKGDYIQWKNPTSKKHNVTAYGAGWTYSKILVPGATVKRQFNNTGTFRYRCTYHSAIVDGKCQGQCGFVHVFSG